MTQVCKVKPPAADGHVGHGPRWNPVAHGALLEELETALFRSGVRVKEWRLALSRGGLDLTAAALVQGLGAVNGVTPCLGLTASNAKRGMRVYCGGRDEKTGVSAVYHSWKGFDYKAPLDLITECKDLVAHWHAQVRNLADVTRKLQIRQLKPEAANGILIYAGRNKIIPWSWVGRTESAWRRTGGKSAWDMLGCFGPALARAFPTHQMSDALRLFNVVMMPSHLSKE